MDKQLDFDACEIGGEAYKMIAEILSGTHTRLRISQLTDIPEKTLQDYFSGRTSPTLDRFLLIALAAGQDPASFFGAPPRPPADPGEQVMIPVMDVRAAAGSGEHPGLALAEGELPFPRAWLRALARGLSRPECIRAAGDSMEPTIRDGALVIVDRAQTDLAVVRRGKAAPPVFVFVQDGIVRLKRLRRQADGIVVMLSDNPAWPPEAVRLGEGREFEVLGRAIWVGNPI